MGRQAAPSASAAVQKTRTATIHHSGKIGPAYINCGTGTQPAQAGTDHGMLTLPPMTPHDDESSMDSHAAAAGQSKSLTTTLTHRTRSRWR